MKKTIILVFIGIIAGFSGAFIFYKFRMVPEIRQMIAARNQSQDFSLSNAMNQSDDIKDGTFAGLKGGAGISDLATDFTVASQKSTESVVYVKNTSEHEANTWFDWFFNDRVTQTVISSGSGVIYSPDGFIVTNNHVVENALSLEVIHNKRTFEAKLIGSDPSTDIAVLKIEASNLPSIMIGTAKNLQVGEWVLAVGNPFNLNSTVTAGIVSAKGRQINILKSVFPIESFIQTDAAINPGNSGGALVNSRGELVGINTAILSRTGSYAGYGFAVPVDIVTKVVDDIIKYGEVQKAFFGAVVADINENIGKKYGIEDLKGVLIQKVMEDGAASRANLQEGDIIITIEDQNVNSHSDFDELISYHSPGDKINIRIRRNGDIKQATLTLTNSEGTTSILKREVFTSRTLGADFEVVSKAERDMLGIAQGVRITKIKAGLIRNLDIEEGFIVTSINRYPVKDPAALVEILTKIRGKVIIEGVNKQGSKGYYSYFF
jgi:Do/DeqQ family serine protease